MNIVNETNYSTRAIRSIIVAVYRQLVKKQGAGRWWRTMKVTVTYAHSDCRTHGWAFYDGRAMRLRVNRVGQLIPGYTVNGVKQYRKETTTLYFTDLVAHELMHCWGYRHRQFVEGAWRGDAGWDAMMQRLPSLLPLKPQIPRPQVDITQVRYRRLLEQEARWTSKLKRAQSALRKLRTRRRGYERRMAARTTPNTEGKD